MEKDISNQEISVNHVKNIVWNVHLQQIVKSVSSQKYYTIKIVLTHAQDH